jgi:putative hydrolase of the HAD superfamily
MMAVRAIYFDAVGTLIHPEPSAAAVYAEVGRRHGSRLRREEIHRRFAAAFAWQDVIDGAAQWHTSEARERRRWWSIVTQVLDDVSNPAACFAELYDHFARPAAWRCDESAPTVIAELKRRGRILGLASNYDHRLHTVLAGLEPLGGIENVLVSAEVGWRKPARAFFEAICTQAGVGAHEVLYVGDDFDNDFTGAIGAGMEAVLLDAAPPRKGIPMIARLEELLDSAGLPSDCSRNL